MAYVRSYSLEDNGTSEISNRYDSWTQSSTTTPVEHDDAGNLWRIGDKYFVFDIFNRLSEVYVATGQAQSSATSTLSKSDFEFARGKILEQAGGATNLFRHQLTLSKDGKLKYSLNSSGGSKSSSFLSFRIMMEGQSGWIIPAQPGLHIAKAVVDKMQPLAEQAFAAAAKKDILGI